MTFGLGPLSTILRGFNSVANERKQVASTIKITETFTIAAQSGETFGVQEHTRCETVKVAGVKRETLGRAFLKTDDGRGVLRNDNGSFSIPSLGVTALRSA